MQGRECQAEGTVCSLAGSNGDGILAPSGCRPQAALLPRAPPAHLPPGLWLTCLSCTCCSKSDPHSVS